MHIKQYKGIAMCGLNDRLVMVRVIAPNQGCSHRGV